MYSYMYIKQEENGFIVVRFLANICDKCKYVIFSYLALYQTTSDTNTDMVHLKLNLCFKDDLSPQRATFFPPITSDNNPQLSSSYTDVCTKICSISLSVTLLAG